ncbi:MULTISPECIES: MmcQ/YjbR family DNA-binding protein [unclassified Streptomyces]|uniref:MmcQ/YjbR family DNA-binding protein n=1 Tax=unclassified Streptomyces TaxID=2593676 RepID=UPI001EFCFAB2|nr:MULTISPECIES: MmcQ/YjbR family DNA-binding protein [unclassified Streptomyces]
MQRAARWTADALPDAASSRLFSPSLEVRKVAGKVFLIVTDDPGKRIITVKAEPEHGRRLRAVYATISAGRYLDKTPWVSVGAGPGISAALVEELVTDSYDLVRDSAARPGPGRRSTP